jgi:hypothetical protein
MVDRAEAIAKRERRRGAERKRPHVLNSLTSKTRQLRLKRA